MNDIISDDRQAVYEIGYLLVSSVPDEKVSAEVEAVRAIITGVGSSVIAEEAPHKQQLAYTMRRKTVAGSYEKYDTAYFGWIKFEVGSDKIEAVKKAVELHPTVLRALLLSTVRENTYLGKRAQAIAAEFNAKEIIPDAVVADAKEVVAAPATIEEMDKSIDAMVKEA